MNRFLLFCLLVSPISLVSQVPFSFESQFAIGSTAADVGAKITRDSQQNLLLFGAVSDDLDVYPGNGVSNINPLGNPDVILVKYNTAADVLWAFNLGRIAMNNGIQARGLGVDDQDFIYISGSFQSNVNFDPLGVSTIESSSGSDDAYIAKYTPDGMLVWLRRIGGISSDAAGTLVISGDKLLVSVRYTGSIDLDPGLDEVLTQPVGGFDMAIVEFDLDGTYLSHADMSTAGNDEFTALATNGELIAAGAIVNGAISGLPERSMALFVFNQELQLIWDYNYDNQAVSNEITTLVFSNDGNSIYVAGRILGNTNFDNTPDQEFIIDPLFADPFFAKYTLNGQFEYAKYIRSSGTEDYLFGLYDTGLAIVVAGSFDISATFDPLDFSTEKLSAGGMDLYFATYEASNGAYLHAEVFGGSGSEAMRDAIFNSNSSLTCVGLFTGNLALSSMSSPIPSVGSSDIFVASFNFDTTVSTDELMMSKELVISPNPVYHQANIQIEASTSSAIQVTIYSISGKLAYQQTHAQSASNFTIDLTDLAAGIYIIEAADEHSVYRQKFVKLGL